MIGTGMPLGFLGLGRMGLPMATRLAGPGLTVWNRSSGPTQRLARLGATVAGSVADVFRSCDPVIVMLADAAATREVLGMADVGGHTIVNMGTISPGDSLALAAELAERRATYVEAPVSGSQVQAEQGSLVAMLAGQPAALDAIEPLLAPICRATFRCGDAPRALLVKLAVNTYLIGMVTALAEAVRLAEACAVDLELLAHVLDTGPMASEVSRIKLAKLVGGDYSAQATVTDVHYNAALIGTCAAGAGAELPVLAECARLLDAAERGDHGGADMVAVLEALRGLPGGPHR